MPESPPHDIPRPIQRGKRFLDFTGALIALVFAALPMIAIALWILLRDGRPLLHRDQRIGRGGVPFQLLKFRTLHPETGGQRSVAPEDDPRITAPGRHLRPRRLDELPQLINVLTGDMSLVGPRPMPPAHANTLPPELLAPILAVRPGITGPASIQFLAEDTVLAGQPDPEASYLQRILPAKAAMQHDYLQHWSLTTDLLLLLQTLNKLPSKTHRQHSAQSIQRLLQ